jgi:micrococcal nuclease
MYEYNAICTNVVDGDTIDVIVSLGFEISYKTRVRLYNIDTPEARTRNLVEKAHGLKAKEFVKNCVLSKDIIIKTVKDSQGKYGRYLAHIFYEDESGVTHSLVEQLKEFGFDKKESY